MPTALVIHAHPDDEVFATGAAIAMLADSGWTVALRVATGGEASEDPDLSEVDARTRRTSRLNASCKILGVAEWDWLAEPGRWIDDGAAGGARSLATCPVEDLAAEIRLALVALRPELVLSVGRDGLTGHPDHVAIAAALQHALRSAPEVRGRAWGARLRADDVRAGRERLGRLLPDQPVGSDRVVGTPADATLRVIAGGDAVEHRRRAALDQYVEGLGTKDLAEVVVTYRRRGDSLLLRAVLDSAGWHADRFERL